MYFTAEQKNPIMFTYGYVNPITLNLMMLNFEDFDPSIQENIRGPFISHLDANPHDKDNNYVIDFGKPDNQNEFAERCNMAKLKTLSNNADPSEKEYWADYLKKAQNAFCIPQHEDLSKDKHYANIGDDASGHLTMLAINTNVIDAINKNNKNFNVNFIMLMMFYEKTYFTPGNKDQFYTKKLEYELFPVTPDKIRMYNVNFIRTETERDYSQLFFQNIISDSFITMDKVFLQGEDTKPKSTGLSFSFPNLVIFLNKVPINKTMSFKYTSISDIISDLGGSFDLIFVIFQIFHNFLTTYNYEAFLLNSVFQYHTSIEDSNIQYNRISTFMSKLKTRRSTILEKSINSPEIKPRESVNDASQRKIKDESIVKDDSIALEENQENDNNKKDEFEIKKNILPSISKLIKNRESYQIKPFDIIKASYNTFFNKATSKDKLISISQSLIENEIDFTKILKNSFDLHILKRAFIEEPLCNYITFPSMSITNPNPGIVLLTKLQTQVDYSEINEDFVKELVKKDLDKNKYNTIFQQIIENR